jgi:hypothetical protein
MELYSDGLCTTHKIYSDAPLFSPNPAPAHPRSPRAQASSVVALPHGLPLQPLDKGQHLVGGQGR